MSESSNRLAVVGIVTATSLTSVIVSLFASNPTAAGPYGVTGWFIALFIGLSGVLTLLASGVKKLLKIDATEKRIFFGSLRQGMLAGAYITLMLAMSSLRQLSLRDALLALALVILIELYVSLKS